MKVRLFKFLRKVQLSEELTQLSFPVINKCDKIKIFPVIYAPVRLQVLVKWYNIYNAPGGPSAHTEWNLFVTCFMTLMGYNTERLTWKQNVRPLRMFFIGS